MLDDIKSQIVNSVSAQTAPQITDFFDNLNAQLQLIVGIAVALSILGAVVMILTAVQRWRSHSAIIRIDKNLQKLVDRQPPETQVEISSKIKNETAQ